MKWLRELSKRVLCAFLGALLTIGLIAFWIITSSRANAGPDDLLINQRNAADTGTIQRVVTHPTGVPSVLFYDDTTLLPILIPLGTGFSVNSGVLEVTAGTVSWASVTSKPTTLSGFGITDAYPLTGNPSGFLTSINSGQVTSALGFAPYDASNPSGYVSQAGARSAISLTTTGSGAATYNSSTGVLNVPTPSTPAARAFNYTTRSLNSCFQVSASRDALVTYSVDIQTSLSLTAGQQGTVYLRTYTNSGCSTGAQEVTRFVNGQTGTLTIGLALSQNVTGTLTGVIPAGSYVQLVTENNTGAPTFTARPGQETLL